MTYTPSKTRMVKNTAFLYVRTLLLLVIGVFTSRITLQALGVNGYGTVNVVSGFVAMFAIISGSLTGTCQRFLTYEMGAKNHAVREVFNASLKIHIILAAVLVLIAETIGLYFVENKLNIPVEDSAAVQWVYQCSVISMILSLLNIPYNAIIISYERLNIFAYFSLIEGVLKLLVVFLLLYLGGNKLIIYSLLTLASAIIMRLIFQIYCRNQFREDVRFKIRTNSTLFKNIFGFAGWTFLGNTATICSNQGVNIVINLFCGVVVNAARGIAMMVESVVTSFVTNFTTALNPQITKSFASGNHSQIIELVQLGFRLTFFLMLLISVPVVISSNELLHIWFTEVPDYAAIFVNLTLIIATIQAIGNPFLTLLLATGKIRNYQITAGILTFLNLPLSYLFLYLGYSPICTYILNIIISIMTFIVRLYYLKRSTQIKTLRYFDTVFLRMVLCGFTCVIGTLFLFKIMGPIDNVIKLTFLGLGSTLLSLVFWNYIGLNSTERHKVRAIILAKIHKYD